MRYNIMGSGKQSKADIRTKENSVRTGAFQIQPSDSRAHDVISTESERELTVDDLLLLIEQQQSQIAAYERRLSDYEVEQHKLQTQYDLAQVTFSETKPSKSTRKKTSKTIKTPCDNKCER